MADCRVTILNLPSPPGMDVERDFAGSYGTASPVRRTHYGHSGDVVFPVFMPYLATAVTRQGWSVHIVDGQAQRLAADAAVSAVVEQQPDFVVSLVSLPSIYGDLALLRRIKRMLPDCILVIVGAVAKTLADEVLRKEAVDFLVVGEYPLYAQPIIELVRAWRAGTLPFGRVIASAAQEGQSLDDLDFDVYRAFPMDKYRCAYLGTYGELLNYFPIMSSKGCPFPCAYCPYPVGFGKTISYKSPERLVDEMTFLHDEFGIRAFLFRDQVFTARRERVEEICERILARRLEVQWLLETRVDKVSDDLLVKMRRAGCNRIHYGIETGDADLLRQVGKPGVDKQAAIEAFRKTASLGIRTVAHVIVGLPGETRQTLANTYEFLGELDPDNTSWNFATPYPGTALFDEANRKGLILTCDWTRYNTNEVVMRTEELLGPELSSLVRTLSRRDRTRKVLKRMRRALHDKRDREYVVRRSLRKLAALASG
jgi:radical SAM superfamily enzyme YgiQ (UPF0313 family)